MALAALDLAAWVSRGLHRRQTAATRRLLLPELPRRGSGAAGFSSEASWMERRASLDEMDGRERFGMGAIRERQGIPHVNQFLGPVSPEERELAAEMRALAKSRQWEQAIALFSTVQEPGPHLLYSALFACTKAFQVEGAWKIFNEWQSRPLPAYNLMVSMLSRTRRVHEVEHLWQELQRQSLEPNSVTYTSLMTAYGTVGNSQAVLRVFAEMETKGLPITEVEYGSAMAACGKSADFAKASELLQRMDMSRIEPHIGHFTSLMLSCASTGDEARARGAWHEMQRRGLQPDVVAYTCLAACLSGQDAWASAQALRGEMEAAGLRPHVFFYNELLRISDAAGEAEAFQRLLREMEETGVVRNTKTEHRIATHQRSLQMQEREREWEQRAGGGFPGDRGGGGGGFESRMARTAHPAAGVIPLPAGWYEATDPGTGRSYYWREDDPHGSVTWERPR